MDKFDRWATYPTPGCHMLVLTKQTFHGHTSPTHIATQGHSGRQAPHTTLDSGRIAIGRLIVPHRYRAGRFTDTQN